MADSKTDQYIQDMINGTVLTTPKNFGLHFQDFTNNNNNNKKMTTTTTTRPKNMYVIEIDDNPRDFSAQPKIYGAYWAETPDPVNQVSIALWPEFGSPDYRDDEDNVDGSTTEPGECYAGSACLGYGQKFVAMSVRRIEHTAEFRNFRTDLIKQILSSRGLSTTGDKAEMIHRAQQAKILSQLKKNE